MDQKILFNVKLFDISIPIHTYQPNQTQRNPMTIANRRPAAATAYNPVQSAIGVLARSSPANAAMDGRVWSAGTASPS